MVLVQIERISRKLNSERFHESWLSPFYQRESAYLAFHIYEGMEYEVHFTEMEQLMKKIQRQTSLRRNRSK
ncbi:D-arabinono-1,4-lactone oxidase [Oceanobacillus sp. J11TS1]|uniref:D-arabinono-1,4-lactone oxidase n=1 Tax=Oceanobacillus sp. J11TS1 TaxID=2807191 RepID=UPI001BB3471B|nr:D-arabinono-1,4-lactone oxidase [Oceanobacillus sp. J11TS1]